jgi:glutamate racemase
LIDPADAVARELVRRLSEVQGGDVLQAKAKSNGTVRFFTSGDVPHVQAVVSHLWGEAARVEPLVSA